MEAARVLRCCTAGVQRALAKAPSRKSQLRGFHFTVADRRRSRVIETLEYIENIYAYYYLGEGSVQSADRLALSLLDQLCDLTNVYSSPIGSSCSNKVSDRILSTADNVSGRLETFESSETTVELTDPTTARLGIDAAHESDGPARSSSGMPAQTDTAKEQAVRARPLLRVRRL